MQQKIIQWLNAFNVPYADNITVLILLGIIFIISLIVHVVLHHLVLPVLRRRGERTKRQWTNSVFTNKLFSRFALLVQGILFKIEVELFLQGSGNIHTVLIAVAQVWIMLFALLMFFSVLDVLLDLSAHSATAQQLPLRGIFQSLKLVAAIFIIIMIVSVLLGKSPLVLITGLGAMTAVLMLVFKDPILGLVAGIQLSANNMLKLNDWLEMPKYGADGAVIDIGLTTVKVRNWDNTVTTIPTYALISDSFKNWRAMSESGGRRIKRSINIDTTSIRFLNEEDLAELKQAHLLAPYIDEKTQEIADWNAQLTSDPAMPLNGRHLTNIGTFRAWLEAWLKAHPRTHKGMTLMVRQLAPGSEGLPVEIYVFTNTTEWLVYESIQSDIFDHIYAVLPAFGLRVHQTPTGNDLRHMRLASSQNAQ